MTTHTGHFYSEIHSGPQKIEKKIDYLKFENAFYKSFRLESKFSCGENQNSLSQIVWLLEGWEGMEMSEFTL